MLGIVIRKGATSNDILVDGKKFSLDQTDKKTFSLTCALVQDFLMKKGYFNAPEVAPAS